MRPGIEPDSAAVPSDPLASPLAAASGNKVPCLSSPVSGVPSAPFASEPGASSVPASVLCPLPALRPPSSVLCPLPSALRPRLVLRPLPSALRPPPSVLRPLPSSPSLIHGCRNRSQGPRLGGIERQGLAGQESLGGIRVAFRNLGGDGHQALVLEAPERGRRGSSQLEQLLERQFAAFFEGLPDRPSGAWRAWAAGRRPAGRAHKAARANRPARGGPPRAARL